MQLARKALGINRPRQFVAVSTFLSLLVSTSSLPSYAAENSTQFGFKTEQQRTSESNFKLAPVKIVPKLDAGQLPTGAAGNGFTVTLSGSNLNLVTKVMLGDKELSFSAPASSQLVISIPPQLAGDLMLTLVYAQGELQQPLVVEEKFEAAVNAGAFNGVVAVYAKGFKGSRLSAKIGEDWLIVKSIKSDFARFTEKVRWKGAPLKVRIYIDGVLQRTVDLRTK